MRREAPDWELRIAISVAQTIDYDEFGRVVADSAPGFQPFGLAGGLYDQDTALVRFGARDYNPYTGRWAAKEPRRFASGGTNLYAYAFNGPGNFVDSDGRTPAAVLLLAGSAAGPAAAAAVILAGSGIAVRTALISEPS